MVGIMAARSREEAASLLHSIKFTTDTHSKLEHMNGLKEILLHRNPSLLPEFIPHILELQNDRSSSVRKFLAEMIGEIGLVHSDFIPEMLPVLMAFFKDNTPAVTRQAITSGTNLFRGTLEKVAIQGLHSSGLDDSLELSWDWMLKFKEILCPIAFQPGADGIRLLAVKFIEVVILLYTPDPDSTSEPQPLQDRGGQTLGFDVSWLRGGHPFLNVGDLSIEASQSLGLLLDQLRFPKVKSLSNSMIVILIKSLSAIAKKRPSFYGRILPVLLGLDPSVSVMKGACAAGVHHTLRNAFLSCLKCTNPAAAPWRNRLVTVLKEMKAGELAEQAVQALNTSGSIEDGSREVYPVKEEKPLNICDAVEVDSRRKRSLGEGSGEPLQDNGVSGKRVRSAPLVSEQSDEVKNPYISQGALPLVGSTSSSGKGDTVQQLGAMFGALVAQGEKAVGSLEILISSISADLLAEVVMANMKYLPLTCPKSEEDGESATLSSPPSTNPVSTNAAQPFSLVSEIASLFTGCPEIASLLGAHSSRSHDAPKQNLAEEEPAIIVSESDAAPRSIIDVTEPMASIGVSSPSDIIVPSGMENDDSSIQLDIHDMETLECGIPGLDTVHTDGSQESLDTSHLSSGGLPGLRLDQMTSLDSLVSFSSGSVPADKSEEVSPKLSVSDANSVVPATSAPVVPTIQFVLPKMSAPVINLTDNQKDNLQRTAFMRIIESYNRVSVGGGSHLRFSLLAGLGVEFPLELDSWKLLQTHIFSDYLNHEGHELTLRVLYRLFREAEQEHDFFSSTTASSVYESFLLIVAETLRDRFPASDKSLSRLLYDVPYIPKSTFKLLESLCCPGSSEKIDKELQNFDRVTQGLSAVWNLILLRPPIRDACLKIALQSAVHQKDEVRMKAIRLVANKLYPISSITQQIEDFATDMLLSVKKTDDTEVMDVQIPAMESSVENPTDEQQLAGTAFKEIHSDTHQSCSSPSMSSSSISEAQRRMSLYFALCTKKHSLFREIFAIYSSIPMAAMQAIQRQIPILVRTIGTSSVILAIISDPPTGSESLLMQVLTILTDGTIPSPDLVSTVRRLYNTKLKDVEILIPVLSQLPKEEVLSVFPQIVNLPLDKFQAILSRLLQGSSHFGPALTPAEVLIAIHGIDNERDGIPLKKVTDACNVCFEQRNVFTQQVIAKVLNHLVEQIPLPMLFMRTVLQAIGAFPALVDFIMEILSRLVTKQIWKYPKLWVGFLKCAFLTKPQSFSVLLQLPAAQLEIALNRTAGLKPPLIAHANQPNIRSSLPRSTLVVLGIAPDSQTSSQAQSTPTMDNSTSVATEGTTDKTKESSTAS